MNKYKVYVDYIGRGDKTPLAIARRHRISRQRLHQIVNEVRKGSINEFDRCRKDLEMRCLWNTKYMARFTVLDKENSRNEDIIAEVKYLYRQMVDDGFSIAEVARLTNKDHATIRHHLKVKK